MRDGIARVQAGAGIVADSNPAAEYEETRDKARALLQALADGGDRAVMVLLLLDNYDSFTFNLAQYLGELGARAAGAAQRRDLARRGRRRCSPIASSSRRGRAGRRTPGISVELIRRVRPDDAGARRLPRASGHRHRLWRQVVRAPVPMHGKTSSVQHDGRGVFTGVVAAVRGRPLPLAGRRRPRPGRARDQRATTDDGTIMGVRHRDVPGARRAVPPRVGADRRGPPAAAEFPGAVACSPRSSKSCSAARTSPSTRRRRRWTRSWTGAPQPAQIAGLLVGLAMKGERPAEIVGLAQTMRARATQLSRSYAPVFDTCGTGGDRAHTFNVSTVAALVVAACGVRVAKHGNRSVSSQCGSADLFEALGVHIAAPPAVVERCLDEAGIAFFFAPTFHPSMRHAGADAQGAGRPHRVQPARPADESGRRVASAGRRAAAGADRAGRALAGSARIGARLGRARRRRPGRDLDHRLHQGFGVPRRRGQHVLRASVGLRLAQGAPPAAARRRCGGQCATSLATCSPATRGAARDIVLLNAGAVALHRRARPRSSGGHRAMAATAIDAGRRRGDARDARALSNAPQEAGAVMTADRGSARHDRRGDAADRGGRASGDRCAALDASSLRRRRAATRSRRRFATRPAPRVIAECKRRSPSRGILRHDYDPAAHARA